METLAFAVGGALCAYVVHRRTAAARAPKPVFKRVPKSELPPPINDLILRAARGEPVERVPVWMMRQAGRYLPEYRALRVMSDFFTVCRTPHLVSIISRQPLERFDELDAVIVFSDILVVPQAMGLECRMVKAIGPLFPNPLRTPEDLDRLNLAPDVQATLGYVLDAINLTRRDLQGRVPLIGFCGGPWTLMAYMVEGRGSRTFDKSKGWLYKYPDASHRLLRALTETLVVYLVAQAEAGAQLLQVFESWAGELSPRLFREFCLPYVLEIGARVKQLVPDVPLIFFPRGAPFALRELHDSAFDVISLDWTMSPTEARALLPTKTLQGNMDPCALYGPEERIREEVQHMVREFGTTGYIANLGHGLHPTHSPDRVGFFVRAVHEETQSSRP